MAVANRFLRLTASPSTSLLPRNPSPRSLSRSLSSSNSNSNPNPRSVTPLERQFDSWVDRLRPGFTPSDVDSALRSIPDPDLALDVFHWTSLRPGYRPSPSTYLTALTVAVSNRRFSAAESIISSYLAGACDPHLPLSNFALRFCCSRRHLFSTSFDLFNRMLRHPNPSHRPSLETYTMLISAILRRFGKPPVSHLYLHAVRSLVRRMKSSGVIPDTFFLNHVIKSFSKCLEMDEAIRVYREMGLYGCEPNEFTYGYLAKGLCEKGRVKEGLGFFKEMRGKGLVPPGGSVYMAIVNSLAMDRRFEEAVEVLLDMLGNKLKPDVLTYRTVLEEMCRGGKGDEAFELLEELGRRPGAMGHKTYKDLLDGLHWLCQPHDS